MIKTSTSRRCKQGFTLIEVLVVLVIISTMTGVLVLRISPSSLEDEQYQEVLRIQALMQMAADEAIISGRELGLDVTDVAYTFSQFDPDQNGWQEMENPPFQQRTLAEGLSIRLKVDDQSFDREEDDAQEEQGPVVLILSSGEITPFDLDLRQIDDNRRVYTLRTDGFSGFELTTPDQRRR